MTARHPDGIDAIVLAAGLSRRTAPRHKLLARDADGIPMIAATVRRIQASRAGRIVVVLGHRSDEIRDAIQSHVVSDRPSPGFVIAPDHERGLSATLRSGIGEAQAHGAAGAMICLGDMPLIPTELLDRMIAAHQAHHPPAVVVMHDGRRGNPVLWDRRMFPSLLGLTGDEGARGLLRQHEKDLLRLPAGEEIHLDFDTPDRLEQFSRLSLPS
ncbi:nucleotidyltransferase family protein [Novacetimonas pomaceti]|uniref:nucleotidyltransferase family protein n=1 Tax=Novacetimonas pomaceti TaxID=2021998 RepID=UPI001C2D287F|nr:nucleotidyltransferase family protein [Novacetimonas pomaceti]MBV1834815.1 nucleotidyltransferase family protein [Novacetimonas pomaceti]